MTAPGICRDCAGEAGQGRRCAACGSPRVLRHAELHSLALAHVDCDAFYAAVEKRDRPELADRPVIVGGGRRGVVSTACYIARTYGVRSAMPMFKALDACPEAVVIKPDMEKYVAVGRGIRALMLELTPLVEPLSIDEAFLDLGGTERVHKAAPAVVLARFARQVEAQFGVTVSVGLSYCKFLAKIASDLDKPRGFAVIGRAEAVSFLSEKPLAMVPGIGPAALKRLNGHGLRLIGDVARMDVADLYRVMGREGERLRRLSQGIDPRSVTPERDTKSVSAETTFDRDISDLSALEPILWRLAERVSARLKRGGLAGRSVTLKLKTEDFRTRTRTRSGLPATQLAQRLYDAGHELLSQECDGTAFRLIGIGAGDLSDGVEPPDLLDLTALRVTRTEQAIDSLRERYGSDAIIRGIAFPGRDGPARDKPISGNRRTPSRG